MAKILRKNMKIFGSTSGFHEMGQFGSLAAGSPAYTTDPDVIQSLSNYLGGWYDAVLGNNSPAIQDMNSLHYLYAYQLAYLMQNGVAEWNTSTTYFSGSFVTSGGIEYVSLTDNNLGNAVTDTSNWRVKNSSIQQIENLKIVTSVATNAMTIALKTLAGNDPSPADPIIIGFRDVTSATGDYVTRFITAATSLVLPVGATLGASSGVLQYIYPVLLDNSGTVELATIGSRFDLDEGSVASTTAISGGSTDWNTLYSTTSRSNKAIRLIGRIANNQTVAGTYGNNSTEISPIPLKMWPEGTSWKTDLTWTHNNFGTQTFNADAYRRERDTMFVKGELLAGTTTDNVSINLPTGLNVDFTKLGVSGDPTQTVIIGLAHQNWVGAGNTNVFSTAGIAMIASLDKLDSTHITFSTITDTNGLFQGTTQKQANNNYWIWDLQIPIKEWRSY